MTRHRLLAGVLTCLTLALVVLSGCTRNVEGAAMPLGMRYRTNIISGAKPDDLAERDKARLLDPCGMIDDNIISTLGTPVYFGMGQNPDECAVRLDRATITKGITSVEVTLSILPYFSGEISRIGNRRASTSSSENTCFIALQYNDKRAFHYAATAVTGVDACTELRDVVTASLPLLDKNPLRANSTKLPKTKGGSKDPCAALDGGFPAGQRFHLSVFSPFECDAWPDGYKRDDSNRFGIQLFNMPKSVATYVPSQARKLQLAGVDAIEEDGASGDNYCIIHAYVGVGQPFPTRDWQGQPEDRIDTLRITGHGCTQTRTLAVAAVKAYQQD